MLIFLDLDGVLAKCHESALLQHGCQMQPHKPMHQIVNETLGRDWKRQEFWDKFGYDFWACLPETPLCIPLIHAARSLGEVYVLTKPTNNPESYAGKAAWCKDFELEVIMMKHKRYLSAPGRLLIDDSLENVNEFRCGGGDAVLVPRPWNVGYHDDESVLKALA